MKLKCKSLIYLLALCISTPTFAITTIESTFSYENIHNTLEKMGNSYIISSDNVIMALGASACGLGGKANSSTTIWKPVITDVSGSTLNDVVNISAYHNVYALDSNGDVYYINDFAEKIDLGDVKFKDIGEAYSSKGDTVTLAYLIAENGDIYKGSGKSFSKIEDMTDIDSIYTTSYNNGASYREAYTVLLTKGGTLYRATAKGVCTKVDGIFNVKSVYPSYNGFFLEFNTGKIGYLGTTGNTVTDVDIPEGEVFKGIINQYTLAGLITDKNIYSLNGAKLTPATAINTVDQTTVKPIASGGSLAIDESGAYYEWTLSGTEFKFSPIEGIDGWVNENPIVPNSELGKVDITLNTVYKRSKIQDIDFSIVTEEQPKSFNFYYVKSNNSEYKEKWVEIEKGVAVSTLNPEEYDTGYKYSDGTPIKGFKYNYKWSVGKTSLVGVRFIIEPIFE